MSSNAPSRLRGGRSLTLAVLCRGPLSSTFMSRKPHRDSCSSREFSVFSAPPRLRGEFFLSVVWLHLRPRRTSAVKCAAMDPRKYAKLGFSKADFVASVSSSSHSGDSPVGSCHPRRTGTARRQPDAFHGDGRHQRRRIRRRSGFPDRKSTRLNSSHLGISYAVFCLK